jgi:hypothetical protein
MDKSCSTATETRPWFSEKTTDAVKRIAGLLVCLLVVALFMFYIGPALEQTPVLKPIVQFIDERDINANMYFYTEVEEFSEANINMDNTMAYPPRISASQGALSLEGNPY